MTKLSIISFILTFCIYSSLYAGGSFSIEDIKPILNQDSEVKEVLDKTFDLAESGCASRIGQNVNPRFGGLRMGPYYIFAKLKDSKGGYKFTLIIHTEHIFLDKNRVKTDLFSAEIIEEKFKSIEVKSNRE